MSRRSCLRTLAVLVIASCAPVIADAQAPATSEEFARRQYESGLEFLHAGKYMEALKDFEAVVDIYPASSVADEALLAIARYQLDVQRNPAAAHATAESLLKKFPASDSVPMSYVVAGQATVAKGLTPGNVEAALATFDRVQRLFAGSEAVAPALVAAGDTLSRLGRCPEALDKFDAVTMAYPSASWAAAAQLSSAACLAAGGRPIDAMQELQRIILGAPASPEAQQARTLNTIINRLYVRPPARSPYGFSGKSIAGAGGRLRDVSAMAFGSDGSLFVTSRTGVLALDQKGTTLRSTPAVEPRALFVDHQGRVLAAQKALLVQEGTPAAVMQTLTVPREGGPARVLDDISAVAVLTSGERLVADRGQRGVFRFDTSGKYLGTFSSVRASRIALGPAGQVALLDRDNKSVTLLDGTGKALSRIAAKAAGYELMNPTDVAFDVLGHLYVLDTVQVRVFAGDGRLVATFTGAEKAAAGTLREGTALALDEAARMYIYDEREQRVQIYQ
jgi:TolA-binding protein